MPWDSRCVGQSTLLINNHITPVALPTMPKHYKSSLFHAWFVPLKQREEAQPEKEIAGVLLMPVSRDQEHVLSLWNIFQITKNSCHVFK